MKINGKNVVSPFEQDEILKNALLQRNYPKFLVTAESGECTQDGLDHCLLFAAAAEGCGNFSEALLDAGASVKCYFNGRLVRSACKGDIKKIDRYLSYGADRHLNNDQPLRSAVFSLQRKAALHLIELGCDFDRAITSDMLTNAIKMLDNGQAIQRLAMSLKTELIAGRTNRPC